MTRTLRLLALAALTALVTVPSACGRHAPAGLMPGGWRYASPPPPVVGRHAMVVSEHPLSSDVGAAILRRGGNAIDAAVAVGFAQAVVNPRAGNIGAADSWCTARRTGRRTHSITARRRRPRPPATCTSIRSVS